MVRIGVCPRGLSCWFHQDAIIPQGEVKGKSFCSKVRVQAQGSAHRRWRVLIAEWQSQCDHDHRLVLEGPLGYDPGPIDRAYPFCYNVVYPYIAYGPCSMQNGRKALE